MIGNVVRWNELRVKRLPRLELLLSTSLMFEPPMRHPTKEAIDFIANRLDLPNYPEMQDWEFEVSEPSGLPQYLTLFEEVRGRDDVRFVLADMIIQAFESADFELSANSDWVAFLSSLSERIDIHGWQIWYWASWDVELEAAWRVSPSMRELCETHFSEQG